MKGFFAMLAEAVRSFTRNNCFTRAAAISFYFLFSLIPIVLLITEALTLALGSQSGLADKVIAMAKDVMPFLSERMIADLKGASRASRTFGWVNAAILVLSAEIALSAMSDALFSVFGVKKSYGFFRRKVASALVLMVSAAAALLSVLMSAAALILKGIDLSLLNVDIGKYLLKWFMAGFVLDYVFPFVIVVGAVTAVYKFTAGSNLNLRHAFYGSLAFGALWEAAKHLFALYIAYSPSYRQSSLYGSLGAVMLLFGWIFSSTCLFLFTAAASKAAFDRSPARPRRRQQGNIGRA